MPHGGLMRNPLEFCSLPECTGILIIDRRKPPGPKFDGHSIVGGHGQHVKPEYYLHHLFCNACGVVYQAHDAGHQLVKLREKSWEEKTPQITSVIPERCEYCDGKKLEQEPIRIKGPDFARTRRRQERQGVFCTECNSTLGYLPEQKGILVLKE